MRAQPGANVCLFLLVSSSYQVLGIECKKCLSIQVSGTGGKNILAFRKSSENVNPWLGLYLVMTDDITVRCLKAKLLFECKTYVRQKLNRTLIESQ